MTRSDLEAAVVAAARDWYASAANREAALAGAVQALEQFLRRQAAGVQAEMAL